jgi:prolyl oligopeptidase
MKMTIGQPFLSVSFAILAFSSASQGADRCSALFSPVDAPASRSTYSQEWIQKHNHELNAELSDSPNKRPIEKWVWKTSDHEKISKSRLFRTGGRMEIVNRGLAKSSDLVMVVDGKTDVLFSSFQLRKNNSFTLEDYSLSTDEKTVALSFAEKGSTDDYRVVVVDIATKAILKNDIKTKSSKVIWMNGHEFLYGLGRIGRDQMVGRFDVKKPEIEVSESGMIGEGDGTWSSLWTKKGWLIVDRSGLIINIGQQRVKKFIGATEDKVIFLVEGQEGLGALHFVKKVASLEPVQAWIFRAEEEKITSGGKVDSGYVLAKKSWGADRWIQILNSDRLILKEIAVPSFASVKSMEWNVPGKSLKVSMASAVVEKKTFIFDIENEKWDSPSLEADMMKVNDVEYVSNVVMVKSADGTDIPMRLTMRKGLARDNDNPVFFEVYGGFNQPGRIDPVYSPLMAEFIKRGGIYACPVLRGGGEYGSEWYKAGIKEKKKTTMLDLIAAARWMVKKKWSKPSLIISTGTSNGGFVVASAGLMAPKDFGLVIPVAGVLDTAATRTLDPQFWVGWSRDYGNPELPEIQQSFDEISPVELVEKKGDPKVGQKIGQKVIPKFLVISGRDDSRVNAEHSYRFVEALEKSHPGSVLMLNTKNSGHWVGSFAYQNVLAWRMNVVKWTTVFDYLGWKFEP